MIETKWKSVTNRGKWAARGASFVGKVKATKVVWFPPKPVETTKKVASRAEDETLRAVKRTSGAATSTTGTGKKASSRAGEQTIGAVKKTSGAKNSAGTARRTTGTGKKAASTAGSQTVRTAKKTPGVKNATGTAKRTTGTAKRSTGGVEDLPGGSRRQKKAIDSTDD